MSYDVPVDLNVALPSYENLTKLFELSECQPLDLRPTVPVVWVHLEGIRSHSPGLILHKAFSFGP